MAQTKPCLHCGHSKGMHVKNVRPPLRCKFFQSLKDGYPYTGPSHTENGRPTPGVHRYYCLCIDYAPDPRVAWDNAVTVTDDEE